MKSYSITLFFLLLSTCLWAQAPPGINYQAIAWDATGPIINQPVDVRMTLTDGNNSSQLYQETHVVITNDYGLFTLVIGSGTPVSGTFAGIAWENIQAVVQTEIDLGNGWVNLGSADLQSVPYALHANGVAPFPLSDLADVSATAPANGEVLKWNGTEWTAASDNGTAYTAGTGIAIVGTQISNTGDVDSTNDITNATVASGDLSGFYPSPVVSAIQNRQVSVIAPISGQVLKWDGTQWTPATDNGTAYTAGAGIDLTANVISNTGDTDPSDDITVGSVAGGDLNGFYPNPEVVSIRGHPVSPNTPIDGEVYKYSAAAGIWLPSFDEVDDADNQPTNELQLLSITPDSLLLSQGNGVRLYTDGDGIDIINRQIFNTGDTIETDDINIGDAATGDLAGNYPSPTVGGLRGIPISPVFPSDEQVLSYNAATGLWSPSDIPENVLITDGSGNPRVVGGVNANGNGFLHVYDSTTNLRAGIQITGGQGELFGDVKNFRVPHPALPEKEIWYASLEGPEAAAYLRGTAELVDGKATIPFPEHFQHIATETGMTVLLTPLSGKSRGLAVIKKSLMGFEVVELMEGTGNYSFDWEVKCVRQGQENFEVVRPAIRKP